MLTNCSLFKTKLIIKERPLSATKSQPLKLVEKPKAESELEFENQEKFDFLYAQKNKTDDVQVSTEKMKMTKESPIINGIVSKSVDVKKHLTEVQNNNSTIQGWSAKEVAEYRKEIEQTIKPETLAAMRKLAESRQKTANKRPASSVDQEILTKIQAECQSHQESDPADQKCDGGDASHQSEDVSFLPISPKNNFVNMDKLELDKVAWMRQVDASTAAQTRDKSVRFHLDGRALPPWVDEDEHEKMMGTTTTESCLEDALLHHGDEPDRMGYTVSELFWLARSAFPAQRSVAVTTLTRVLVQSRSLAHVHRLGTPSALGALVECGLPFLARWLIDDARDSPQPLHEALALMHAIVVATVTNGDGVEDVADADKTVDDDVDHVELCWPSRGVAAVMVHLSAAKAHRDRCQRLELAPSERAVIHDDVAMRADLVECLVTNTGLIDRLDFLLVTRGLVLPMATCRLVTELLERIARHSLASASSVARSPALARLLADHLLPTGNRCHEHHISHANSDDGDDAAGPAVGQCVAPLVRLVRVLISSRCVATVPVLAVLDALYPWLGGTSSIDNVTSTCAVTMESVRLATVLWDRGIARGVVASVAPALCDQLEALLASPRLRDGRQARMAQTLLALVTAFSSTDGHGLPSPVESCVQRARIASMTRLSSLIADAAVAKHDSNCALLANIVHLAVQTVPLVKGSRHDAVTALRDTVVMPIMPVAVAMVKRLLGDSLVLGREHREPGLALWSPSELPEDARLLCNSLQLAEYTRNPNCIDVAPHTVSLHAGFALLSAVCQAISTLAAAGILTQMEPLECFLKSTQVLRLVHDVARCPTKKMSPCSPHSALVQLQLEAVSRLVLCLVDANMAVSDTVMECQTARDLHQAAIKMLPVLGPRLADVGRLLIDRVVFNKSIVVAMDFDQSVLTESLLDSLPRVAQTYRDCFPGLTSPPGYGSQDTASTVCIDSFLMTTSDDIESGISNLAVSQCWIDAPFAQYHQQVRDNPSQSSTTTIVTERVIECLGFVWLLERLVESSDDRIDPIISLRRLVQVLLAPDWTEFSGRNDTRQLIATLTRHYLARPDAIAIDTKFSGENSSFFGLYAGLIDQFFSVSIGDPLLANLIVFPCAMRFPDKYRKTLWKMHIDSIRMINIDISESVFPISEYLEPEESDAAFIQHYWLALKNRLINEERNPLLYWVCVHHLNRFVYRHAVSVAGGQGASLAIQVQRGFAHLLCNPSWQALDWVRHVRSYKHFVERDHTPRLYEQVPATRLQRLEQLRDCADHSVKRFETAPRDPLSSDESQ